MSEGPQRLAPFFVSISLKTRMVLLVAVMFIAGIWVLAFSVTLALQRDITQLLSASLSAEVGYVASDLDRDIQLQIDVLDHLAASLKPDIQAEPAKLDRALDQFTDSSPIVPSACFAANRNGIVTARYPEQAIALGASVGDRGYFREVMASGRPVIGSAMRIDAGTQPPTLPIAVPLRGRSGETTGVLVGFVPLSDRTFTRLKQTRIGQSGYLLVVSPGDRTILSAPDPKRLLQKLPPRGVIPQLDRRLEEGFEGAGTVVTAVGIEQLGVGRRMATTGWMVLAGVPTHEAFAPIDHFKRRVYVAAVLISLVVAAMLWFVLGRQLAPLGRAARAMRRMTDGEVPMTTIPVGRQDEIGELISNFNQLVAERTRLEQSLRESNDRLEGIYRSVGDGIVSVDDRQRIVLFNTAAERIFGRSAAETIGEPLGILLPERFRTRHAAHFRNFAATGESTRTMGKYGLIYGLRASGEEFPVEATVSHSGSAPDMLFTVILRDITVRMKAEQAREQLLRQLELFGERLASVQEDERRKVAHELHEELGQDLATLKIQMQLSGTQGGEEANAHLVNALQVAEKSMERVRRLALDLAPLELEDLGLYAAVRAHCKRQAISGNWKLHVDVPDTGDRPSPEVERGCFHVAQEALSNVLRHAKASDVWVKLHQRAGDLELVIRDNGVGFDQDGVREQVGQGDRGLGLLGMRLRARQAGGRLEIRSCPAAGTEVQCSFPMSGAV